MTDYSIAIPTYQRVDLFTRKTYRLLERYHLLDRTTLFLQTDADVAAYTTAFPDLPYVRAPLGFVNVCNFICDHYPIGHPIVQLHDDIAQIYDLIGGKCVQTKDADQIFQNVFRWMKQESCSLGGVYPMRNAKFMERQPEFTTDLRFIHDPITLLFNRRIPLDDPYKTDWQRTILYYEHDGGVLRYNHVGFTTTFNPVNAQGGIGYRSPDEETKAAHAFQTRYPQYITGIRTHKTGSTTFHMRDTTLLRYDIHHKPLVFESTNLYHRNMVHTGTRYAIVLYNKDYSWASDRSPRTHRTDPFPITKKELSVSGDAFALESPVSVKTLWTLEPSLLEVLEATSFRPDRCRFGGKPHSKYVNSERSRFLSFGLAMSRKSRKDQMSRGIADRHSINQNNTLHPVLFDMLCTYLTTVHPNLFGLSDQFAFTSLIVARNAMCRFHLDADNRGPACIVGVGDYRGGELLIDVGRSNRRIDRLSKVPVIPRVTKPENESDSDGQEDQQNGSDDMDESDSECPWTGGGGGHDDDVWGGL
jgi:hypothetical protein